MKAIWEAGLRIPEDIAIVGIGNLALGDMLRVPFDDGQLVPEGSGT
jgi:DNA-binding LacI/PurR family transcriptional regulator